MSRTVTEFEVHDIRLLTSEQLDGSDAMNLDPDYSAAYVVIRASGGAEGHGLCFTIGRGNDVTAAAIEALRPYVIGRPAPRTAAVSPPSCTSLRTTTCPPQALQR